MILIEINRGADTYKSHAYNIQTLKLTNTRQTKHSLKELLHKEYKIYKLHAIPDS